MQDRSIGKVVLSYVQKVARKLGASADTDELEQLGRIVSWKAAKEYDGRGTLEGYIHECLWRNFRDVMRSEVRHGRVFDRRTPSEAVTDAVAAASLPDEDLMLKGLVASYKAKLTPTAYLVFHEMVLPNERTLHAALATNRRRRHLKSRGRRVNGYDKVKIGPQQIASSLGVSTDAVNQAMTEIRAIVRADFPRADTEEA